MRSNGARVETGGRGRHGLGVGRFWDLSRRGGGWLDYPMGQVGVGGICSRVWWGDLWEQGIFKEGLGGRNGDDVGEW